jgi:hypothetical protein
MHAAATHLVELRECQLIRQTQRQLCMLQHVVEVQVLNFVTGSMDLVVAFC